MPSRTVSYMNASTPPLDAPELSRQSTKSSPRGSPLPAQGDAQLPAQLSLSPLTISRQFSRTSGVSQNSREDTLDDIAYRYSLRVAVLSNYIEQRSYRQSSPGPSTPPSQSRQSSYSGTANGDGAPQMRRPKSSFGLNLKKKNTDALKFPKEFLVEFWEILENERGDPTWKTATGTFLRLSKKGTKTPSGLNLREIPTLLDSFTQVIPPNTPVHIHQTHLVQLLWNSLPRCTYFSPLARPQSEKDRDLLFRLRAELQTYMTPPSPDPTSTSMSSNRSPSFLERTESGASTSSSANQVGGQDASMIVNTMFEIWEVPKEVIQRDIGRIYESGPLETIYMRDLKTQLGQASNLKPSRSSTAILTQQVAKLVSRFPNLGHGSPALDLAPPSPIPSRDGGTSLFFSPSRRIEVFKQLVQRASGRRSAAMVVDQCRDIWCIPSLEEREHRVEALYHQWAQCPGSESEIEVGYLLADAVRDLAFDLEGKAPVLDELLDRVLEMLHDSVRAIFPLRPVPPPSPPPYLADLIAAMSTSTLKKPQHVRTIEELEAEIQAMAVQEYVASASGMMAKPSKDSVLAFEGVAKWIDGSVGGVQRAWGSDLRGYLDPPAIILRKQLPLYCAELQSVDVSAASSGFFTLYDVMTQLSDRWGDLCPDSEFPMDIQPFFEPHIVQWLRDHQDHRIEDWVARSIGMDNWRPQPNAKHSQSVVDLFQFCNQSLDTLQSLPLSNYKRAVYHLDLSKSISLAVQQYANTVKALYMAEIVPVKAATPKIELPPKLGNKAANWLAKGQQAVKSLEKKKLDGFVIPVTACTKIMDVAVARQSLDDLAINDVSTKRISQTMQANHKDKGDKIFKVRVARGENMLAKASEKAADTFVAVFDKASGTRLLKSQTVLGSKTPRWDETIEVSANSAKNLEIAAYNRLLVGKHEPIGSATFRLDPLSFANEPVRDIVLPLSPRGVVHLRIDASGDEQNDVETLFDNTKQALDRVEGDMIGAFVDLMVDFAASVLSVDTLKGLMKLLSDKKRQNTALTDPEIDSSLGPLLENLNLNFSTLSASLEPDVRQPVMLALWRGLLDLLISLLLPSYSDKPTSKEGLGPREVQVVFKWLQTLKGFFNASENGIEHGVPISQLQSVRYRDLLFVGQYLDLPSSALQERCSAAVKSAIAATVFEREDKERTAETLLRIARMRPELGTYLAREVAMLTQARMKRTAL